MIGSDKLSVDIALYSAGLFPFFQFSTSNVKPMVLDIFEEFIIPLGSRLKPSLTGLLIALLPGLEEGKTETFTRVRSLCDGIRDGVGLKSFCSAIWLIIKRTPRVCQAGLTLIQMEIQNALQNLNNPNKTRNYNKWPSNDGVGDRVTNNNNNKIESDNSVKQRNIVDENQLEKPTENALNEPIFLLEPHPVSRSPTLPTSLFYLLFPSFSSVVIPALINTLEDVNSLVNRSSLEVIEQHLMLHAVWFPFSDKVRLISAALPLLEKKEWPLTRRVLKWFLQTDVSKSQSAGDVTQEEEIDEEEEEVEASHNSELQANQHDVLPTQLLSAFDFNGHYSKEGKSCNVNEVSPPHADIFAINPPSQSNHKLDVPSTLEYCRKWKHHRLSYFQTFTLPVLIASFSSLFSVSGGSNNLSDLPVSSKSTAGGIISPSHDGTHHAHLTSIVDLTSRLRCLRIVLQETEGCASLVLRRLCRSLFTFILHANDNFKNSPADLLILHDEVRRLLSPSICPPRVVMGALNVLFENSLRLHELGVQRDSKSTLKQMIAAVVNPHQHPADSSSVSSSIQQKKEADECIDLLRSSSLEGDEESIDILSCLRMQSCYLHVVILSTQNEKSEVSKKLTLLLLASSLRAIRVLLEVPYEITHIVYENCANFLKLKNSEGGSQKELPNSTQESITSTVFDGLDSSLLYNNYFTVKKNDSQNYIKNKISNSSNQNECLSSTWLGAYVLTGLYLQQQSKHQHSYSLNNNNQIHSHHRVLSASSSTFNNYYTAYNNDFDYNNQNLNTSSKTGPHSISSSKIFSIIQAVNLSAVNHLQHFSNLVVFVQDMLDSFMKVLSEDLLSSMNAFQVFVQQEAKQIVKLFNALPNKTNDDDSHSGHTSGSSSTSSGGSIDGLISLIEMYLSICQEADPAQFEEYVHRCTTSLLPNLKLDEGCGDWMKTCDSNMSVDLKKKTREDLDHLLANAKREFTSFMQSHKTGQINNHNLIPVELTPYLQSVSPQTAEGVICNKKKKPQYSFVTTINDALALSTQTSVEKKSTVCTNNNDARIFAQPSLTSSKNSSSFIKDSLEMEVKVTPLLSSSNNDNNDNNNNNDADASTHSLSRLPLPSAIVPPPSQSLSAQLSNTRSSLSHALDVITAALSEASSSSLGAPVRNIMLPFDYLTGLLSSLIQFENLIRCLSQPLAVLLCSSIKALESPPAPPPHSSMRQVDAPHLILKPFNLSISLPPPHVTLAPIVGEYSVSEGGVLTPSRWLHALSACVSSANPHIATRACRAFLFVLRDALTLHQRAAVLLGSSLSDVLAETLWMLLGSQHSGSHATVSALLLELDAVVSEVKPKIVSNAIMNACAVSSPVLKRKAVQRFAVLWHHSQRLFSGRPVFPSAMRLVLESIDAIDPVLRHVSRSWISSATSVDVGSVLDPIIFDLLNTSVATLPSPRCQYAQSFNSAQVLYALESLESLVRVEQTSFVDALCRMYISGHVRKSIESLKAVQDHLVTQIKYEDASKDEKKVAFTKKLNSMDFFTSNTDPSYPSPLVTYLDSILFVCIHFLKGRAPHSASPCSDPSCPLRSSSLYVSSALANQSVHPMSPPDGFLVSSRDMTPPSSALPARCPTGVSALGWAPGVDKFLSSPLRVAANDRDNNEEANSADVLFASKFDCHFAHQIMAVRSKACDVLRLLFSHMHSPLRSRMAGAFVLNDLLDSFHVASVEENHVIQVQMLVLLKVIISSANPPVPSLSQAIQTVLPFQPPTYSNIPPSSSSSANHLLAGGTEHSKGIHTKSNDAADLLAHDFHFTETLLDDEPKENETDPQQEQQQEQQIAPIVEEDDTLLNGENTPLSNTGFVRMTTMTRMQAEGGTKENLTSSAICSDSSSSAAIISSAPSFSPGTLDAQQFYPFVPPQVSTGKSKLIVSAAKLSTLYHHHHHHQQTQNQFQLLNRSLKDDSDVDTTSRRKNNNFSSSGTEGQISKDNSTVDHNTYHLSASSSSREQHSKMNDSTAAHPNGAATRPKTHQGVRFSSETKHQQDQSQSQQSQRNKDEAHVRKHLYLSPLGTLWSLTSADDLMDSPPSLLKEILSMLKIVALHGHSKEFSLKLKIIPVVLEALNFSAIKELHSGGQNNEQGGGTIVGLCDFLIFLLLNDRDEQFAVDATNIIPVITALIKKVVSSSSSSLNNLNTLKDPPHVMNSNSSRLTSSKKKPHSTNDILRMSSASSRVVLSLLHALHDVIVLFLFRLPSLKQSFALANNLQTNSNPNRTFPSSTPSHAVSQSSSAAATTDIEDPAIDVATSIAISRLARSAFTSSSISLSDFSAVLTPANTAEPNTTIGGNTGGIMTPVCRPLVKLLPSLLDCLVVAASISSSFKNLAGSGRPALRTGIYSAQDKAEEVINNNSINRSAIVVDEQEEEDLDAVKNLDTLHLIITSTVRLLRKRFPTFTADAFLASAAAWMSNSQQESFELCVDILHASALNDQGLMLSSFMAQMTMTVEKSIVERARMAASSAATLVGNLQTSQGGLYLPKESCTLFILHRLIHTAPECIALKRVNEILKQRQTLSINNNPSISSKPGAAKKNLISSADNFSSSELMAVLQLANNLQDVRNELSVTKQLIIRHGQPSSISLINTKLFFDSTADNHSAGETSNVKSTAEAREEKHAHVSSNFLVAKALSGAAGGSHFNGYNQKIDVTNSSSPQKRSSIDVNASNSFVSLLSRRLWLMASRILKSSINSVSCLQPVVYLWLMDLLLSLDTITPMPPDLSGQKKIKKTITDVIIGIFDIATFNFHTSRGSSWTGPTSQMILQKYDPSPFLPPFISVAEKFVKRPTSAYPPEILAPADVSDENAIHALACLTLHCVNIKSHELRSVLVHLFISEVSDRLPNMFAQFNSADFIGLANAERMFWSCMLLSELPVSLYSLQSLSAWRTIIKDILIQSTTTQYHHWMQQLDRRSLRALMKPFGRVVSEDATRIDHILPPPAIRTFASKETELLSRIKYLRRLSMAVVSSPNDAFSSLPALLERLVDFWNLSRSALPFSSTLSPAHTNNQDRRNALQRQISNQIVQSTAAVKSHPLSQQPLSLSYVSAVSSLLNATPFDFSGRPCGPSSNVEHLALTLYSSCMLLCRCLLSHVSSQHLTPMWPLLLSELINELSMPSLPSATLSCLKVIDLASNLELPAFQSFEWIFVSDITSFEEDQEQDFDKRDNQVLNETIESSVLSTAGIPSNSQKNDGLAGTPPAVFTPLVLRLAAGVAPFSSMQSALGAGLLSQVRDRDALGCVDKASISGGFFDRRSFAMKARGVDWEDIRACSATLVASVAMRAVRKTHECPEINFSHGMGRKSGILSMGSSRKLTASSSVGGGGGCMIGGLLIQSIEDDLLIDVPIDCLDWASPLRPTEAIELAEKVPYYIAAKILEEDLAGHLFLDDGNNALSYMIRQLSLAI